MIAKLDEGGEAERRVWELFGYLRGLGEMTPNDLLEHLVSCRVWRRVDDQPVYRTPGEPFVLFTAYDHDERIRVVALGVADLMSPEDEARCERLIEARCRASIILREDEP